jgi:hypothetical protein
MFAVEGVVALDLYIKPLAPPVFALVKAAFA